ncbi:MAG: hypothetical protein LBG90_06350 [Spirochaetaceae bacterium]|jgi:hypothetical protein|nr:hypothetical protein [Spirochaetaceae bacterium]
MEETRLINIAPDSYYNKLIIYEQEEYYKDKNINFTSTYFALDRNLEWCEPTTPRKVFFDIINQIPLKKDFVFLDCGSGLGHVVFLAGFFFKKIYGVEYIEEIAKISEKNLKILMPHTVDYTIFYRDMQTLDMSILNEVNIFYISSPYNDKNLFDKFMVRIKDSILLRKREVWVIYFYPYYEEVMEKYRDILPLEKTFQTLGKVNYYHHI